VSSQLHAPATRHPGKNPNTYWIWELGGPRSGLMSLPQWHFLTNTNGGWRAHLCCILNTNFILHLLFTSFPGSYDHQEAQWCFICQDATEIQRTKAFLLYSTIISSIYHVFNIQLLLPWVQAMFHAGIDTVAMLIMFSIISGPRGHMQR